MARFKREPLHPANDLDVLRAGEVELARIWTKVEQVRAK